MAGVCEFNDYNQGGGCLRVFNSTEADHLGSGIKRRIECMLVAQPRVRLSRYRPQGFVVSRAMTRPERPIPLSPLPHAPTDLVNGCTHGCWILQKVHVLHILLLHQKIHILHILLLHCVKSSQNCAEEIAQRHVTHWQWLRKNPKRTSAVCPAQQRQWHPEPLAVGRNEAQRSNVAR